MGRALQLAISSIKGRHLHILLQDRDSPVTALEVESGKPACSMKGVKKVIDVR